MDTTLGLHNLAFVAVAWSPTFSTIPYETRLPASKPTNSTSITAPEKAARRSRRFDATHYSLPHSSAPGARLMRPRSTQRLWVRVSRSETTQPRVFERSEFARRPGDCVLQMVARRARSNRVPGALGWGRRRPQTSGLKGITVARASGKTQATAFRETRQIVLARRA
jgi:hypothetical protein